MIQQVSYQHGHFVSWLQTVGGSAGSKGSLQCLAALAAMGSWTEADIVRRLRRVGAPKVC